MDFANFQQYFYQILYSIYRRKNLVLTIILLSTIIVIVTSQINNLSTEKDNQDVYNERSQFFVQDNQNERFQDANVFRKSLDENGQESDNRNEILQENDKNEDSIINKSSKKYTPELKLVHFDLKGAPPKIDYLKKLIRLSKEAGANGILLEYEDVS